jgi:hypothetical protein
MGLHVKYLSVGTEIRCTCGCCLTGVIIEVIVKDHTYIIKSDNSTVDRIDFQVVRPITKLDKVLK